jgi:hypothetical protein
VVTLPNGWQGAGVEPRELRLREGDPLSARVTVEIESVLARGSQGRFHIVTRGEMTSDATHFQVVNDVSVRESGPCAEGEAAWSVAPAEAAARPGTERAVLPGEREVFARSWERRLPRDLV